jgi:hypothetical protein
MAPSHGFAAASHREAALRGAPASMARPRSEAQRGSVRPAAAMRSAHRALPLRVAALADGDGLGIRPARKHDTTPNFGFRPHATRD